MNVVAPYPGPQWNRAPLGKSADQPGKRGEQVARKIEAAILAGTFRLGDRIGQQEQLAHDHNVSRWVMREAIAIMEMDGLVECRRGHNGGLFVSSPAVDRHATTLRNYFCLCNASALDINRTRALVEEQVIRRVMRKLTPADADRLRAFRKRPAGAGPERASFNVKGLLDELVRIADHPALALFFRALSQANIDRSIWYGAPEDAMTAMSEVALDRRLAQIEVIVAGDDVAALRNQSENIDAAIAFNARYTTPPDTVEEALHRSSKLGKTYRVTGERPAKKPEAVARMIAQTIVNEQLQPGQRIGSESELLERFRVGRNVVREATRLLERVGIVRTQEGPDGGLLAIRPDPSTISRATSFLLAPHYQRSPATFYHLTERLQLEAVAACAMRAKNGDSEFYGKLERYRLLLSNERRRTIHDEVFEHYLFAARNSGNPVLECIMRSMVFEVDFGEVRLSDRQHDLQLSMVMAMSHGDAPLAGELVLTIRREIAKSLPARR